MGVTVLSAVEGIPIPVHAPIVEVKADWGDDWVFTPELEMVRMTRAAAGHDLGVCELAERYGEVRQPWDSDYQTVGPVDRIGWWVRVKLVGPQGETVQWIGQISGRGAELHGRENLPSGWSTWVAYEPLQILRKKGVHESKWLRGSDLITLGWLPDMNGRDARRLLVGNRSASKPSSPDDDTYVFGGTELWNRRQFAEYILHWFVDDSDGGGPAWRLGGQASILEQITDSLTLGNAMTAAEILRKVIPLSMGVDFRAVPWGETGFTLEVFSLAAEEAGFAGSSLARNPNTVEVITDNASDLLKAQVVETGAHLYDRIRVLGRRIVVCCTLNAGLDAPTLIGKWDAGLETAYKAGDPDGDEAAEHDAARRADKFRPVYQLYGAPDDVDLAAIGAAPAFDADGQLASTDGAAYQRLVRRTLSWTPLREGYDYSADPPVNNNPTDYEPEMLPPAAWVFDPASGHYVAVEKAGISISVVQTDWGVFLQASPNHALALNHFSGAASTDDDPVYDWTTLLVTLAFESDRRIYLETQVAEGGGRNGGAPTRLDIEVADAECWYLAPSTFVGTIPPGQLRDSGGAGRVLRNDTDRLALVMAGAIARYRNARARASLHLRGLLPWGDLVGQVMSVIQSGGETQRIQAVITSVEWLGGTQPQMMVRTGYAS